MILGFPCNQVRDVLCALTSLYLSQFSNPPSLPFPMSRLAPMPAIQSIAKCARVAPVPASTESADI